MAVGSRGVLQAGTFADTGRMLGGFSLRCLPCEVCGASVPKDELDEHVCDPERLVAYEVFKHRDELANLPREIDDYLGSPRGRFEAWYAERRRNAP